MKFNQFLLYVALSALIMPLIGAAKTLNLYDQPKPNAKITGTVDSEAGIIPIYTPKGSDWIKVANPENGQVGWIKQTELSNMGNSNTSFTFSQTVSGGKGPHAYVIQYGTPKQLPPEQAQLMLKQIQQNQAAIQQDTQKMIEDIFQNMNQQQWVQFPIVMPVVILPQHKAADVTK